MDLHGESDIEQLRRVAIAQQIQIEQLLRVLRAKAKELSGLKGNEAQLQQTLSLVEDLSKQAQDVAAKLDALPAKPTDGNDTRKPRESSGPTEQPLLPVVEQTFELDDADKTCPSCGGTLSPMKGQFETSEMIDVVEVSYRVVRVQQRKYVCKCGGCIETAPGPERVTPGGRYALRDQGRRRQVSRSHPAGAPRAHPATPWPARHDADALGSSACFGSATGVGIACASCASAHRARHRAGSNGLAEARWQGRQTLADVVLDRTRRRCASHSRRQEQGDLQALMDSYRGTVVCDALKTRDAGARGPAFSCVLPTHLDDFIAVGLRATAGTSIPAIQRA